MNSVQLMVENRLQVTGISKKKLAESIGTTQPNLSKFFKGTSELGFLYISKVSNVLDDGQDSILRAACVNYYEKPENVKLSLEYLSTNRYLDDLRSLLDSSHFSEKDEQWRIVYELVYEHQKRSVSPDDLIYKIRDSFYEVKDNHLKVLLTILEGNAYIELKEFQPLFRIVKKAEELLNETEEGFIKNSLEGRKNELKARGLLFFENKPQEARYYANLVISSKIGAKFEADAYYLIGTSFLFENVGQAIANLQESVRIYRESGREKIAAMIEGNIEFAKTFGGFTEDRDTENMDDSEKAFLYAKKGEEEKAVELLDGLEETSFRLYYRGIATGDDLLHFQALNKLKDSGNNFYAKMPLKELLNSKEQSYRQIAKTFNIG